MLGGPKFGFFILPLKKIVDKLVNYSIKFTLEEKSATEKCHPPPPPHPSPTLRKKSSLTENFPQRRKLPLKKLYLMLNIMTGKIRKITYYEMLLIQAPVANSEHGQIYKMGILTEIVDGLKAYLKTYITEGLIRWH